MSGLVDLHCHLLWGLDDGPREKEESLQMARELVGLGYRAVAPSPHALPQFASRDLALARLIEAQEALEAAGIPLELSPNAENRLDGDFLATVASAEGRRLGAGAYALVEAPYASPVPGLLELVFRLKLSGVTLLFAHPERCLEFERKGRAAEAVRAGACLQLDLGSLIGKYGPVAKKLARAFLEEGLYAVAASDAHSAEDVRQWLGEALAELHSRVGEKAYLALLCQKPAQLLRGEPLEV